MLLNKNTVSDNDSVWKILTIDDLSCINRITKLLLDDFAFLDRNVMVLEAASIEQAKEMLQLHSDIAVIIMDIMVENRKIGLQLIQFIRHELKNLKIRIILRTGYPDTLPSKKMIHKYEIDNYISKDVMFDTQMEVTVMTSIRVYNHIITIERLLQGLAGSIAHELRNPLHAISLSSDVIQDMLDKQQPLDPVSIKNNISIIQDTTKTAENIISILLNNMRHQQVDTTHFLPLDIATAAAQALTQYPFQDDARARVTLDIQQTFIFKGDATLFNFVIFNLLKNALYYFCDNQKFTINISIVSTSNANILYFKDTGIGIAADKIPYLFQDFMTSEKDTGTGLGLSFCSRVMKSFSGSISCQSQLGEYTQFTLSFPVIDLALSAPTVLQKNLELGLPFNNKTVLFVEDQLIVSKLLQSLLKDIKGLNIYFAENGQTALEKAHACKPDIIFTDLKMPLLSGKEMIDALRASDVHRTLIIISLSANYPDPKIRAKVDDVLMKPVNKKHLIDKLHQYLD